MTRLPCILLLSLCLVPQGLALEPDPAAPGQAGRHSDLSKELDAFVQGAIEEGILTPVGPAGDASATDMPAVGSLAPASKAHDAPRAGPAKVTADRACERPYDLDFAAYRAFSRYQDLYAVNVALSSAAGASAIRDAVIELVKADIALGLYSEALMASRQIPGPDVVVYQKLAVLMQNRQPPDVPYFMQLASCHEEAGLWLSVAQLAAGQDAGVARLQNHLTGFRQLPLGLRTDFAAISVAELHRHGEKALAQKLVASFTEDELRQSRPLQFANTLIELERGNPEAEKAMLGFLSQPRFQEEALAVILRRDQPLADGYNEILLGDLMQKFGTTDDRELASSLKFALRELSAHSRYTPLMDLARKPALQNSIAQEEIKRYLVASLERDLASEEPLRNLAAIGALAAGTSLLDGHPKRAGLYNSASGLAIRFGFGSLAAELARKIEADEMVAREIAALAFQQDDHATVYAISKSHPRDEQVNLIAARCAIQDNNVRLLDVLVDRLTLNPQTILALIEQDALSGKWIVPTRVYQAADRLSGIDHAKRVKRVSTLRTAAQKQQSSQMGPPVSDAGAFQEPEQIASTTSPQELH